MTSKKTHFDGFLLPMISCKLQALNKIGLRVVMDVVYNHLHASGPFDDNSVLDKVVLSYSHLLNSVSSLKWSVMSIILHITKKSHRFLGELLFAMLIFFFLFRLFQVTT